MEYCRRCGVNDLAYELASIGTALLELVKTLTIDTTTGNVGDVVGDVQRRNGRVVSIKDNGTLADVTTHAPLAALAGYTIILRSLIQDRKAQSVGRNSRSG